MYSRYPTFLWIILIFLSLFLCCQKIDVQGVLVPPTVNHDIDLPQIEIEVAGIKRAIHVRTFGDPTFPTILILHGTYSDLRPYLDLCEELADRYYVVIYDQRGCGLSERITEAEFTLETAIEEINAIKAIYSPDGKITLIGHSWGGAIGTYYTAENPEEVEQLVLIEPMPLTGKDMESIYQNIIDVSYFESVWNELARHGQALSPNDHEQLDYRAKMILKSKATANYHCDGDNPPEWQVHRVGAFLEYVRYKRLGNPQKGFNYDFRENIGSYQDSVLILGGACSSLGFEMQRSYTKSHFTTVIVVEVADAGHRMHIEKFEEVVNSLKIFLREY